MRFLLFNGRGFISASIRWQTRSHWSHAALLISDDTIIEAWQGAGVRWKKITDWENTKTFEVPTTEEQDKAILAFARSQIGQKYDYGSVMRFVSRRSPSKNSRWFCSELVAASFAAAGVHLFKRIDPAAISPGMLELTPLAYGQYELGRP